MRLTLISFPFEAFPTSIFFDQIPHFNSTRSLKINQTIPGKHQYTVKSLNQVLAPFPQLRKQRKHKTGGNLGRPIVFLSHVSFCRKTTMLSESPMIRET